jgi:hypothetical protein
MEKLREGKHILSIQDIMSRWDCSWNDLIYCINYRGLTPSFYLKRVMCECYCSDNKGGWVRKYPTSCPDGNPIIGMYTHRTGDFSLKLDMAESVPESCTLESLRESLSTNGRFNLCGVALVPIDDDYCDAVIPEIDYEISSEDFQFSLEEVQRFEAEHFTMPDTPTATTTPTEPDPDHYRDLHREDLPEELKAALDAWQYVKRLDTPPAEFKKELRRVLTQNGITGAANERIATVANPHKKAGTPKRTE